MIGYEKFYRSEQLAFTQKKQVMQYHIRFAAEKERICNFTLNKVSEEQLSCLPMRDVFCDMSYVPGQTFIYEDWLWFEKKMDFIPHFGMGINCNIKGFNWIGESYPTVIEQLYFMDSDITLIFLDWRVVGYIGAINKIFDEIVKQKLVHRIYISDGTLLQK